MVAMQKTSGEWRRPKGEGRANGDGLFPFALLSPFALRPSPSIIIFGITTIVISSHVVIPFRVITIIIMAEVADNPFEYGRERPGETPTAR
jgi:hypothetical protein